tara:strand:- start:566 stop:847 length:282 start_codon:yes stop_codon:yes gene_type:complete
MSLANEAGYLYNYSKKLLKLNKRLRKTSGKATKHKKRHDNETKEEKRTKHRERHADARKDLHKLLKEHNRILLHLREHHKKFYDALKKEHKVR